MSSARQNRMKRNNKPFIFHIIIIFYELMQGVELKLTHVHGVGVHGWGSVCEMAIGEWLEDISQNQV